MKPSSWSDRSLRIARIVMNRPEAHNAQNLQMTYDLNAAFDAAVQDDAVKVIILAGNGPHFSAGHDLRPGSKNAAGVDFPSVGNWGGFTEPKAQGRFAREQEIYLQITRRWRNLAKPTIAEVQGKCIAGGLMLAWACDLIVASDDAAFKDPVIAMRGARRRMLHTSRGTRSAQGQRYSCSPPDKSGAPRKAAQAAAW